MAHEVLTEDLGLHEVLDSMKTESGLTHSEIFIKLFYIPYLQRIFHFTPR